MTLRWLPGLLVLVGLVAAWGGARYAACLPLLAATALVAVMAVPPSERRLMRPAWAALGVLVLALSWAVAFDHELALRHTLAFVLAAAVFGLARIASVRDGPLALLAIGLAATAAVGMGQALGWLGPTAADVAFLAPELRETALLRLAVGRPTGTAALPGHFAALLVMAAPLLAARLGRGSWWWRGACAGGLLLAAAGVALSRSLAGFAVAAAVATLAVVARGARPRVLLAGGVLLALVGVAAALLRSDLAALEPVRLRWVNWRTAAWVLGEHPVLGVGLGGVGQAGLVSPTASGNITPYAHNSYLELAAELGVAGIGVVAAAVWGLARLLRGGAREHLPLVLAVAVLPLHNLIDFSLYAPEVLLPWAVLAGALAARVWPPPERPLPALGLLGVLGACVLLAAATWKGEALLTEAHAAPAPASVSLALAAARWNPWTVAPVLAAGGSALAGADTRATAIEAELARRGWVRPASAAWAEMRARLLLATGQRGEALVWAREARRRAPWRNGLEDLERSCAPAR